MTQFGNAKRAVLGWFGDEEPPPPIVVPPPAEGRQIPNLGTVPPPPLVTAGERQQRQKEMDALQADRAAAAKADAALRARTASSAPDQSAAATAPTQSPAPPVPVASAPLPPSASSSAPPTPTPPANATPAVSPSRPEAAAAGTVAGSGSTTSSSSVPSASSGAPAPAPPRPNSLPESLLPSTFPGASPAPVVELPSLPSALSRKASVVAGLLTTSEQHGAVSFAAGASELSAAARNTLDAAAAAALENDGHVRLVPAQVDEVAAPNLAAQRTKMLREALAGAGLPADRVTIGELGGQRIDVYNVFVDY